ncbi:MAG: TniB family NTP-binding protein [Thiobacillaceae bacterium]
MNTLEQLQLQFPFINISDNADTLLGDLEASRVDASQAAKTRLMLLNGEPGSGKTTAIERYMARYPTRVTGGKRIMPVIYVVVAPGSTRKRITLDLVAAAGIRDAEFCTTAFLRGLLKSMLADQGVGLIVMDDFHHLLQRGHKRTVDQVFAWLKALLEETQVPILLVGIFPAAAPRPGVEMDPSQTLNGDTQLKNDANSDVGPRIVQRTILHNGWVQVFNIFYTSRALKVLGTKVKRGQRVQVKLNPENLDSVQVLNPFTQRYLKAKSDSPDYTRDLTLRSHQGLMAGNPNRQERA